MELNRIFLNTKIFNEFVNRTTKETKMFQNESNLSDESERFWNIIVTHFTKTFHLRCLLRKKKTKIRCFSFERKIQIEQNESFTDRSSGCSITGRTNNVRAVQYPYFHGMLLFRFVGL